MAVGNHLPRGAPRIGKAEAVDDVVETGLEKLEEDQAGHAALVGSDAEVAAELALQDAILIAELLLLGESDRILGLLATGTLWSVHARAVVFTFQRLGRAKDGDSEAAADFCFGASVT